VEEMKVAKVQDESDIRTINHFGRRIASHDGKMEAALQI
jgi:hypothetical protein